ncbi:MAG: WG repeat-containing protein [Prevotellaceae bacterium]|jgi:hypothetical protein|nr:WG repeat-containing protein [Prevotellaceae bacterium]
MTKKLLFGILLSMLAVVLYAQLSTQENNQDLVLLDKSPYDFGTVSELGTTTMFRFRNDSKEPVSFLKVQSHPAVIVTEWSKESIQPGEIGEIKVTLSQVGRRGFFSYTITVITSNNKTYKIVVQGESDGKTPPSLAQYDNSISFYNGYAAIKLNGKWGFININGKEITPLKYDEVSDFNRHGIAKVKLNEKWGFIDKTGKEITQIKYDDIDLERRFINNIGFTKVKLNGKYGFINEDLKEITLIKYDDVQNFNEKDFIEVRLGDKILKIDRNGNETFVRTFTEEDKKAEKEWEDYFTNGMKMLWD